MGACLSSAAASETTEDAEASASCVASLRRSTSALATRARGAAWKLAAGAKRARARLSATRGRSAATTTTGESASGGRGVGGTREGSAMVSVEASAEGALPALPVPPPLPSVAATAAAESRKHGHHGRAASVTEKLKELLPNAHDRYLTLEDAIVLEAPMDAGEKTMLMPRARSNKHTLASSLSTSIANRTGVAKDVIAKVAKAATSKMSQRRTQSLTAVELAESPNADAKTSPPAAPKVERRTSEVSSEGFVEPVSAIQPLPDHKREDSNPFLDEGVPSTRVSSDHEYSDSGIPSPRSQRYHRRSMSGGAWSEVSYTTSDDGMLRMCHTSLAPSKPRRWTKGDNLGEGSYGSVWLALNGDTGELFALKEVRVGSSDKHRDESIEQLEQEVEVLSRLVHPNIVRYIGITREETALYIFLEYVPGGSIASLVQRFGKFEENVIRVYTRQILIGLAYLHSQRVVHRDIKGANILVEKSGRIKLADFGMAKVLESVSIGKSFKGSACWMAPEVIRQQNVGFESDIWSVGCTVYEMATGAPPWSDCSTQVQIIFKIASSSEIPTIPEHLSSEGQSFLRLCLQRDAGRRPEAVALLEELFVLDAHRSNEQQSIPGLQYDTWTSSMNEEDVSVRSSDAGSRVNSSRHVARGELE